MRNSNTKGNWLLFPFFVALIAGGSCTNNNDEIIKSEIIKPGVYTTDITLATEVGKKNNDVDTRGLNADAGEFTADYPYDYIYIHAADNQENGHKSLKIPLKEVEYCNDCKGIHLEVTVNEEGEGYTISTEDGSSITLSDEESVYFSTIESAYWEAKTEGATPVNQKDVFVESDTNEELLRSRKIYSKEELISLIQEDQPIIEMSRHCTGFRVYFMFSKVNANGSTNNNLPEDFWNTEVPNTVPGNFYIKLYFGPNFCHKYDILNNTVVEGDEGGYYSTNNQQYQPLEAVQYSFTGGSSETDYTYIGFGYQTADLHYLLSPLNTNIPAEDFSLYAFVKYSPTANSTDEEFLSSDEGAKYFQAKIEGMTLETNRVHFIVMAFDASDLIGLIPSTDSNILTRSPWLEPERIDLKPIKVIVH